MMLEFLFQATQTLPTEAAAPALHDFSLRAWLQPAVVLAAAVVLGFLFKSVFLRKMAQFSARTKTDLDDLIVEAVKRHIPFWFLLGGLVLAVRGSPLDPQHHEAVDQSAKVLLILSLSFVAANLLTGITERATQRAGATFISTSLTRNVLRGVILIVGGLMVLSSMGVKIEPLLTALGVGSLAVALALQPTLSNLFAGLHITLAKTVRIGDFVELENGIQGSVIDIGWRATKLREGANNQVTVPNARLVEMISRNYSLPEAPQNVTVPVGVSYACDLERVEAVTLEVARELQESSSVAVRGFQPAVRFQAFGPSAVDLVTVLRVRQLPDRAVLVHEFVKRLKARYEREGIEIPYPQQVVHQPRE
ncbi:MAG: mechanosensitive ion channel family protein [Planctomycetes bacterium]|nr:mechanosensitive ion channel family protein [Planctomycetota bacterium]